MAWACRFANLGVTPSASVIWLFILLITVSFCYRVGVDAAGEALVSMISSRAVNDSG